MNLEASPNSSASLDRKPNPSLPALVSECIFGSPRREALAVLRTARPDQWDYTTDPVPQIRVQDKLGRDLLLQYSDNEPHNGAPTLQALHFTSERGALHLDGTCELAQRITRFAARAFGALLQNEAKACLQQLKQFVAGTLEAPSTYDKKESHYYSAHDRLNQLKDAFATIELPSGELRIHWHKHQFHLSMEERTARYELLRRQVPQIRIFSVGGFPNPMYMSSALPVFPSFPSSDAVQESISAALSQQKLDTIAGCLGVTPLEERFSNHDSPFSSSKYDLLFTALQLAEEAEKKS